MWSTVEKTALADAEVEYLDHVSNTIYAAFNVKKTEKEFLKNSSIIIWTTTPWTIPANKALAYNSHLDYSLVEIDKQETFNNNKVVVASDLLDKFVNACKIKIIKK